MKNIFPIIRGALLGVVAAWTLIVLGIAIHFQTSFVDSAAELTYVSLAVFVAAVTLALFLVVLVAPCNKFASIILRTKWELVWLGALAVLWTALAGYTTSPAAKDNEVECWDEDEQGNVVDTNVEGYSNDVYHARYRVLQAFAFFNCILLLFLFLFILLLAFWHHKRGRYVIWTTPTTAVGWFDRPTGKGTAGHSGRTLPAPITQRKSHKDERYEKWDNEKEVGSGRKRAFTFDDAEGKVKDKFRSLKTRVGGHSSDKEEKAIEKMTLVQKPAVAVRKPAPPLGGKPAVTRSNSTPLKPRQYVVGVPAGESTKPALAPIAAKMAEERRKPSDTEPKRQQSQRERMDRERQAARRGRDDSDEREGRHAYRGVGNIQDVKIKRSGSVPAGVVVDGGRGQRRDGSREPTRPDVVRSGSGAKASGARQTRQEGESSGTQTKNPYRQTPGRRV